MSTLLTTPEQIARYRLASLRSAIKLEIKGMKLSRGVSASKIAAQELGLKPRTAKTTVLAKLEELLAE